MLSRTETKSQAGGGCAHVLMAHRVNSRGFEQGTCASRAVLFKDVNLGLRHIKDVPQTGTGNPPFSTGTSYPGTRQFYADHCFCTKGLNIPVRSRLHPSCAFTSLPQSSSVFLTHSVSLYPTVPCVQPPASYRCYWLHRRRGSAAIQDGVFDLRTDMDGIGPVPSSLLQSRFLKGPSPLKPTMPLSVENVPRL